MKFAILGADDETLQLAAEAVLRQGHQLVAAFDCGQFADSLRELATSIRLNDDWESLLVGSSCQAVIVGRGQAGLSRETGIPDEERRADQFRKLAQEGVPLLLAHPACEAIVGFEIEMIRRASGGVMVPWIPGERHPLLAELARQAGQPQDSPIGQIEQIVFEREQHDRSRPAVLAQFARDAALLRQLIGTIRSVSASGPAPQLGRDPLGPRTSEKPALGNLSVALSGTEGIPARWSIGPAAMEPLGRITLVGERGKTTLYMPESGRWRIEPESPSAKAAAADWNDLAETVTHFSHAVAGKSTEGGAWLAACRDQEAAETIDRSLARGRTIELYGEQHTEEASFKGVMAMGGCLLLVLALAMVLIAAIVEGLQLPLRNWAIWQAWPFFLLAPIGLFLLLQLFQLAVPKDDAAQSAASLDKLR
jgi:hypothetical protein